VIAKRRRNPFWVEMMRDSDHEHVIKLWLPAPVGIVRGIWVSRASDRPDFSKRDSDVLTVLRPHLASSGSAGSATANPRVFSQGVRRMYSSWCAKA
jgi:hypothetical protein